MVVPAAAPAAVVEPVLLLVLGRGANRDDFHVEMERFARERVIRVDGDFIGFDGGVV